MAGCEEEEEDEKEPACCRVTQDSEANLKNEVSHALDGMQINDTKFANDGKKNSDEFCQ